MFAFVMGDGALTSDKRFNEPQPKSSRKIYMTMREKGKQTSRMTNLVYMYKKVLCNCKHSDFGRKELRKNAGGVCYLDYSISNYMTGLHMNRSLDKWRLVKISIFLQYLLLNYRRYSVV